jgi:L-ascorbate metabolism protein UlaG (beta-lactamase superfamily)
MLECMIFTPDGIGRYISFDGNTGKVIVEMPWGAEVEYPGDKCFSMVQGGC